jgi:hypothetical protein
MNREFYLDVPLELQHDCEADTPEKCGATCVQMVLLDIDPPDRADPNPTRATRYQDQEALFQAVREPVAGSSETNIWYNPPKGMASVLNKELAKEEERRGLPVRIRGERPGTPLPRPRRPRLQFPPVPNPFDWQVAQTYHFEAIEIPKPTDLSVELATTKQVAQIEQISKLLVRTINQLGIAPIIAVREDNAHWVVVNGFSIEAADGFIDLPGAAPAYRILSLRIRNPLGRYRYTDVFRCGSLQEEITGRECSKEAAAVDIVKFRTWVREYLFDDRAENFVIVTESNNRISPDLSKVREILTAPITEDSLPIVAATPPVPIKQAAADAIATYHLAQPNKLVSEKNLLEPVKVKRLDRIDGDYHLVPVGAGDRIFALINIAEETREFSEATVWPEGHFIQSFDRHPNFKDVTSGNLLKGKKLRLTANGPLFTIDSVSLDKESPPLCLATML